MGKPLYSIQVVRALAAVLVVISHLTRLLQVRVGTELAPLTFIGASGVDLFFIVSGFVMVYVTPQRPGAREFLLRRVIRVAPLYWLMTLFYGCIFLVVPGMFQSYRFRLDNFILALLFLPSHNSQGDILPPLEQGWTLVYEMFFYAAFAAASAFIFNRRIRALAVVFSLMALIGILVPHSQNALVVTYSNPILFEFLAGCALGSLYSRGKLGFSKRTAMLLIGAAVACLALSPALTAIRCPRLVYWGVPAFLLVLACVRLERFVAFDRMRWTLAIGDASYSLYLSHLIVLSVLALAFRLPAARWAGGIPLAPAFLVLCLLIGWLCHRLVERPLLHFARQCLGVGPASRDSPDHWQAPRHAT